MKKKNNFFRVLTIDGGGIKGIFASTILEVFEAHFRKRAVDHFDLICGTSTGSIIAACLAAGIPCNKISEFYLNEGPGIFNSNTNDIFDYLRTGYQSIMFTKYNNLTLKKSVKNILKNIKIEDSLCKLCIPSFDLVTGKTYVYKTNHAQGLSRDGKKPLWEAVLASTAAPTYFPVYESEIEAGHNFVDGGIWANNPSLIGLVETLKYFVGKGKKYERFSLLSISGINDNIATTKKRNSILSWNKHLIDLFMSAQVKGNEFIAGFLSEASNGQYLRIDIDKSKEQINDYKLDNTSKKTLLSIKANAETLAHQMKNNKIIKEIFLSEKNR